LNLNKTVFREIECPELVEGQFAVYVLQCSDESFYIDHTSDIKKRLQYHNQKAGAAWTAKRLPARLVYFYICDEKKSILLEKKLKGWSREKKIKLIQGEWNLDCSK
jgi:putative endonuclease